MIKEIERELEPYLGGFLSSFQDSNRPFDLEKAEWCMDDNKVKVMDRAISVLSVNEGLVFGYDLAIGEVKYFLPEDEEGIFGVFYLGERMHRNGFKDRNPLAYFIIPFKD